MTVRPEPEAAGSGGIAGGAAGDSPNLRFPLLDSLRGLAALAVVLTHTAFVSEAVFRSTFKGILAHLNVGVTLFFLISGFVLYRPFVTGRARGTVTPSVRRYGLRRFMRIAPAYWLALTVLAVFPGLYGVFTDDWWVYYGLLQPYPVYDINAECLQFTEGCGIAQTWSLSVEVAFYVVLPLYALALTRISRGVSPRVAGRRDLLLLAVLGAVSAVLRYWVLDKPGLAWMHVTVLSHFLWFALGMGLAVVSVSVHERQAGSRTARAVRDHPSLLWGAAAIAFLVLTMGVLPPSASPYDLSGAEQALEHVGFGLVVLALMLPGIFGTDAGGLPRRLLASPALRWLGEVSYGVFLWHLTVMFELAERGANGWLPGNPFVSLSLWTLAVTVPLAAASYYLVERPLMRMTWRRRMGTTDVTEATGRPQTAPA